ncbi:MAG: hypothetical protein U0401_14670 [Anaerolineae bacterium]
MAGSSPPARSTRYRSAAKPSSNRQLDFIVTVDISMNDAGSAMWCYEASYLGGTTRWPWWMGRSSCASRWSSRWAKANPALWI